MGRKRNPFARPYRLTPEAIEQRRAAAVDRWAALTDAQSRTLPGRPRKKRRKRDDKGRFIPVAD